MNQIVNDLRDWINVSFRGSAAVDALKKEPEKYEGLYEAIYQLSGNPAFSPAVLKEWNTRAEHLCPGSTFAALTRLCSKTGWAEKHPSKAGKYMLRFIEKAGISRDVPSEDKKLHVNPLQASAYRALDGHTICADEVITVITAAWYCNGMVVEHGMAGEF